MSSLKAPMGETRTVIETNAFPLDPIVTLVGEEGGKPPVILAKTVPEYMRQFNSEKPQGAGWRRLLAGF